MHQRARKVKHLWFVYATAAAALWGLEYVLLGRLFDNRISPVFLLSAQMFTGAVVMGTVCIASGSFRTQVDIATGDRSVLLLIALSAVVFTLGTLLIAISIKEGSPLLAGLVEISYSLFILLFSVLLGWSEPINPRALLGGLLIIVGAVILKSSH